MGGTDHLAFFLNYRDLRMKVLSSVGSSNVNRRVLWFWPELTNERHIRPNILPLYVIYVYIYIYHYEPQTRWFLVLNRMTVASAPRSSPSNHVSESDRIRVPYVGACHVWSQTESVDFRNKNNSVICPRKVQVGPGLPWVCWVCPSIG